MKTFKSYGKGRTHFTELAAWLAGGEAFSNQTGTLSGAPVEPLKREAWQADPYVGRLYESTQWKNQYVADTRAGLVDYVIRSYDTPIAWHVRENGKLKARWVQPDIKYSLSTSNHQGRVATAIQTAKGWES